MKLIIFLINLLYFIPFGYTQTMAVENTRNNIAYPLMEQPLIIVSSLIPCSELLAASKTGTITRDENCIFIYTPLKIGIDTISIYKINNNDKIFIEKRIFRILKWPPQHATFGNIKSGTLKRGVILAQSGPIVNVEGFDIDATIPIISFKFRIIRNQKLICDLINTGSKFNPHSQLEIEKIKSGDKLTFTDILIKMPGEEVNTKLEDLEIKVE